MKGFIFSRRPICNNNPESAPHYNNHCFILCWRCCGSVLGIFHGGFFDRLFGWSESNVRIESMLLLILPAVIDYYLIKFNRIKPSNKRRCITGILLGFSVYIGIRLIFARMSII